MQNLGMNTSKHWSVWIFLGPVLLVLLASGLMLADGLATARAARAADQLQPPTRVRVIRTLSQADGWAPLATYDPADKRLTIVVERLPADALICIRDICQLPAVWVPAR